MSVRVKIAGAFLNTVEEVTLGLKFDSVTDTFSIKALFKPELRIHRIIFRPGALHRCEIYYRNLLLLTGIVLNVAFSDEAEPQSAYLTGYSVTGVIEDTCILNTDADILVNELDNTASIPPAPLSFGSKETNGLAPNLVQLCQILLKKYGIPVVVDEELSADPLFDAPFNNIEVSAEMSVVELLDEYAQKRNVVLSHTADGKLLITRAKATGTKLTAKKYAVIEDLNEGKTDIFRDEGYTADTQLIKAEEREVLYSFNRSNCLRMKFNYNGQAMHRVIQVLQQAATSDATGGIATGSSVNPYVPSDSRGLRFRRESQRIGDADTVNPTARMLIGDELKNITLSIDIEGWQLNGFFVAPNQIITVINPNVYLFKETKWFVREVSLTANKNAYTATLNCVLPECFNKELIKSIYL